MYPTNHHKPADIAKAADLATSVEDAKLLAGGMTLLPTMKQHLAAPSDLVDLGGIPDLKGICVSDDVLTIGAMTTHRAVAGSADVAAFCPALATLAGGIGDPAVRARGTIGGSLANNDPAACYPSAVLALGATIHTNQRKIAAADYFAGMFTTALEPGEVITAVSFPRAHKAAYAKFPNPASRYAMVGVFVAQTGAGARVAVTGAGADGVFRHDGFEAALDAKWAPEALDAVDTPADGLMGDIHASPAYRAHLIRVMAKRAVAATL